jgi:hypothetical protein
VLKVCPDSFRFFVNALGSSDVDTTYGNPFHFTRFYCEFGFMQVKAVHFLTEQLMRDPACPGTGNQVAKSRDSERVRNFQQK